MKIAVTATGPTLDDQVDPRFGRCAYFLIIDAETINFEDLENSGVALGGGVGIQSGQVLADNEVQVLLTCNCGPNAFRPLEAAGIQVIMGVSGLVCQAVEKYKSDDFSAVSGPNIASHFGTGANNSSNQLKFM